MLTKRDLDPFLINRIKEEYYKNKSFKDIENILGYSRRAIRYCLKTEGVNANLKRRYLVKSDYFNSIDTEYKKYLLGFINADGCLAKTKNLMIQSIDEELIRKMADELNISQLIRYVQKPKGYPNGKPAYKLNFSDDNIYNRLTSYYAKDLAWTNINLSEDGIYNWSFILGFFDGDGCAYKNKNRSGGLVNILAPDSVCQKIKNFTGMGSIIKHSKDLSYWRIFSKKDFIKFYNNCYKDNLGLLRKKKKIEEIINSYENNKERKSPRPNCL